MAPPLIGITTSLNDGEQRLDHRYVRSVEQAGGLPVIVPMLEDGHASTRLAELLDGLVVTGGPAVEIGMIGGLPKDISPTDPTRTISDNDILESFLAASKPVLGICYGMQLVNALLGGRIYADVETQQTGAQSHSEKRGGTTHTIDIVPDSIFRTLVEADQLKVNTRHIQAIESVAKGLRVAAMAPDGVIEAIESEDGTFIGVQFHPERMVSIGPPLFRYLIERAAIHSDNTFMAPDGLIIAKKQV